MSKDFINFIAEWEINSIYDYFRNVDVTINIWHIIDNLKVLNYDISKLNDNTYTEKTSLGFHFSQESNYGESHSEDIV